jgi:hypothetical protein
MSARIAIHTMRIAKRSILSSPEVMSNCKIAKGGRSRPLCPSRKFKPKEEDKAENPI